MLDQHLTSAHVGQTRAAIHSYKPKHQRWRPADAALADHCIVNQCCAHTTACDELLERINSFCCAEATAVVTITR
jgi:hypothetical protein